LDQSIIPANSDLFVGIGLQGMIIQKEVTPIMLNELSELALYPARPVVAGGLASFNINLRITLFEVVSIIGYGVENSSS
jgi:hypothetical protein